MDVCARKDGRWTRFRKFVIHVSQDNIDDWGITYRRIAPGYAIFGQMGLYERELSTFAETPLIENSRMPGMCVNCHTANRTNPEQYVFHARGKYGATIVHRNGKEDILQAKNDQLGGSMVYPYWHPDGRFCAFTRNSTAQIFHTHRQNRIEVFDYDSDVFIYDTERHQILQDSLTIKEGWSENCPAFSPDGNWLYFTTAQQKKYPEEFEQVQYNLCRTTFDKITGRLGTTVDTLVRADTMGKSITWPRPSYDGRFLMYTLIDYGYFSAWHPEADLWLLDMQTGENRPIAEANSNRSESLHNWSSNSRWFLFNSRREDEKMDCIRGFTSPPSTKKASQQNPSYCHRKIRKTSTGTQLFHSTHPILLQHPSTSIHAHW